MNNSKFPKEYMEGEVGFIKDPFRPEFRYDSRGRLVMPLPEYSKMMLAVEPGSKKIGQSSEDEAGNPQTDPGSLKTGYLHAGTAIRCGPEGGWVVTLAGGDANRPIQYGNETTKVVNFYVDEEGNVYLKGTIVAEEGGIIGGFTIKSDYLESNTTPVACGLAPLDWPFWAGETYANRASAPFRVDNDGKVYASSIELLGGTGVGDLAALDQVDTAQIVDAAIEEAKMADLAVSEGKLKDAAVAWAKLANEAVHADKVWQGGNVITLSAQIKDAIILNAHIDTLAASKITSQIIDSQIANIGWAKILNVAIVNADIINLSADKINAGIMTGRTVRTAPSSNFRLEMRQTGEGTYPNELVWYSSANAILARITEITQNSYQILSLIGKDGLMIAETSYGTIIGLGAGSKKIDLNSDILLAAAYTYGLASSSYPWGDTFLGQTRTRLLYPGTNNTYSLGSTPSFYWLNLYVDYIRLNSSYGKVYHGATEILDFYSTKLMCKKPFGFEIRSGTPGAASGFQGHMYYDTAQTDLVFSNGVNWYKVNATQL